MVKKARSVLGAVTTVCNAFRSGSSRPQACNNGKQGDSHGGGFEDALGFGVVGLLLSERVIRACCWSVLRTRWCYSALKDDTLLVFIPESPELHGGPK